MPGTSLARWNLAGNPFSGLWYTIAVVAMALVVTLFWLPETAGRKLD